MNKVEKLLVIVGRTFFVCVCAFLVVWILTWAFHFAADTSEKPPFTLYSAGIDDFAMFKNEDSGNITTTRMPTNTPRHSFTKCFRHSTASS